MELFFILFVMFSSTLMPKCNSFSVQLPSDSIITGDVSVDADVDLNLNGAPIQQLTNNFNRVAHDIYKASAVAVQKSWNELKQGVDTVANGAENLAENVGHKTMDVANTAVNGIKNAANAVEMGAGKLADAGKTAINSISDLSSYIGNEVKNVEDDFKQTVTNLDNMVSGIIPSPEDVAKETWQKLQEAWRNVRVIGANLWQGINKYQTYLDVKMKQIWDTLDEKSDEFRAAMRNLYTETLTKWYFVMENCENVFKNALTLPSVAYYKINLHEWYNTFEQLIITSSNVAVNEILASAKQFSDTVYNSALANFVINSFPHLTPDQWPYVSIILQDMANVQLLAKQSLTRMQSYVNQATIYIDNLARTDAKAAESELQMLKVEIQAKMKSLIDFTEIPFQRAYSITSSGSLFDRVYETEGIYRDNFQRLLLYCKKYSYDINIDEDEFASISSKISDDGGWLSYLTASDTTKNYERDLQNIDYYEMISHKRLVADLNNVFDMLLSDLKLAVPANDFSSKMIYYNFSEEVRAFRQAVSYLHLYVSQCIIYIDTNYPKNSNDYMIALDQLNAEVNKRFDVLSYRTQCALVLAINCKYRLMTTNGGQIQTSNQNAEYSKLIQSKIMSHYPAQTTSTTDNYYSGQSGTEYTPSPVNQLKNMYNMYDYDIGVQSNSGLQPGTGYSTSSPIDQLTNTYQYNNFKSQSYNLSEIEYTPPPPVNLLQMGDSRSSQADIEKQFSSKMHGKSDITLVSDLTSPLAQETQHNSVSYLNNAASYDSGTGSVKRNLNFNNGAGAVQSAQYSRNNDCVKRRYFNNISPSRYENESQNSRRIYESVPNLTGNSTGSNDKSDYYDTSMSSFNSYASSAVDFTENSKLELDSLSQETATSTKQPDKTEGQLNYNQINAQMSEMQTSTNLSAADVYKLAQVGQGNTEQDMFYSSVKKQESNTNMVENTQIDSDDDGDAELSMQNTKTTSSNINSSVTVKEDENPSDGIDETTIIQEVINTEISNTMTTISS